MVDHGDMSNYIATMADNHLSLVTWLKQLILFQTALKHIDAHSGFSIECAIGKMKGTALLTGTNQAGINDGRIVNRHDFRHTAFCLLILHRTFISCGQQHQRQDQDDTYQDRGSFFCKKSFHNNLLYR